jgi:type IV pilus assembly protein PilW
MRRQRSAGITLVEVLIALLLGLFLLAGVLSVFLQSQGSYRAQAALNQINEIGRYAVDTVAEDIRRAGYLGGNTDMDQIRGSLGPSSTKGACAIADNSWGRVISEAIFGLNDTNAGYACIPSADYVRGDILVLRYASPVQVTSFDDNRLYIRSSLFEGRIFAGAQVSESHNVLTTLPLRDSELVANAYYIGASDQRCNGTAIPALYRRRLDANGRPTAEEVALGIEQLQVRYGVDADADGAANQYRDADAVANWEAVVAVRLWLLARAHCPEGGYENTHSFEIADQAGDDAYEPADNYRRALFSSTVMLRNRRVVTQ